MDSTELMKKSLSKNKHINEVLQIVDSNISEGKIWAIGGLVYRSISSELYDTKLEENFDFDFIVEKQITGDLKVPEGWEITKTNLGCPRLISGKKQIDFIPLSDISARKRFGWDATIENYFKQVPLTIQAIAYDIREEKVIGDVGIKAISEKTIQINNLNECRNFCKNRRMSIRRFIEEKSRSLGFKPTYPEVFEDNKNLQETVTFYDSVKEEYGKNRLEDYDSFSQKHLSEEVNNFLEGLNGKRILDLGCGTGRDSAHFKSLGFNPVCCDFSEEMVKICRDKGLEAYQKNIENLDFDDESFDGIWAYASLVHLPKFSIHNVISRMKELLRPEGLLFLGMLEGEGEVLYENKTKSQYKRLFSLYNDEELREIISYQFDIISFKKISVGEKQVYLNYLCKKKKD